MSKKRTAAMSIALDADGDRLLDADGDVVVEWHHEEGGGGDNEAPEPAKKKTKVDTTPEEKGKTDGDDDDIGSKISTSFGTCMDCDEAMFWGLCRSCEWESLKLLMGRPCCRCNANHVMISDACFSCFMQDLNRPCLSCGTTLGGPPNWTCSVCAAECSRHALAIRSREDVPPHPCPNCKMTAVLAPSGLCTPCHENAILFMKSD